MIELFTPMARLEAIIMLLTFTYLENFMLYQMNVKSVSSNEYLTEEVYVDQPSGFENVDSPTIYLNWIKLLKF